MVVPFVFSRVKKPHELVGERVEMVGFVVFVSVAAAVGLGKIVRVGSSAQTDWDDVVKWKCVR